MKIGDKKVLYQETILLPDSTEASFEVTVGSFGPLTFVLQFNPKAEKPLVRWTSEGSRIRIEFDRWTSPLGTSIAQPQKLATLGGVGDLYFYAFHHRLGTTNRLDFQLLIQEAA